MGNEVKPYGPFGVSWEVGGYEGAGMPVVDAYAALEDGMIWLTDSSFGQGATPDGKGAVATAPRKPSVAVLGPSTPWDVGSSSALRQSSRPLAGSGQVQPGGGNPKWMPTASELDEMMENQATQAGVERRLESARSQGVEDPEAKALGEDLQRRFEKLKQGGEKRAVLRNGLAAEMGGGEEKDETGNLKRETLRQAQSLGQGEGWRGDGGTQAAGGRMALSDVRRTYQDSEMDELVRIAMDSRMLAAIDDPNEPSPAVAAKRAQLEERKRQINAAAEARAAGKAGFYEPGLGDLPPTGTMIGAPRDIGQPAGGRMLTGRDIELGGYDNKEARILLPTAGVGINIAAPEPVTQGKPSVSEQRALDISENADRGDQPALGRGGDWDEQVDRTINNSFNSLMRGAVTDGYQMAAEGLYNLAGGVVGRNKYTNMPTPELRAELEGLQREIAVEDAAIKERLKRQPRGFAPPAGYGELKAKQGEMQDELNYREGKGESWGHWLRSELEWTQDEASRWREASREALPVDEEFANSMSGKLLHGVGGLSMLPLYGTVAGPVATVGQVYQEGIDDYRQAMEGQGRPADPDQAHRAAMTYLATAAPAEVLLDKLIVGKVLKAAKGQMTVGQVLKRLGILSASGAVTDGGQQAWINTIASELEGYDPERPVTQGVVESALYSAMLSPVGGAASHYVLGNGASARPGVERPTRRQSIAGGVLVPQSWEGFRKKWESPADERGGKGKERQEEQPETIKEVEDLWLPHPEFQKPAADKGRFLGDIGNSLFVLSKETADAIGVPRSSTIPWVKGIPNFRDYAVPGPGGIPSEFIVPGLIGNHKKDKKAMLQHMAAKTGMSQDAIKSWLSINDVCLHHAGGDVVQIVPEKIHLLHHSGGGPTTSKRRRLKWQIGELH